MNLKLLSLMLLLCASTGLPGCAVFRSPPPPSNPFFVAAENEEAVWERSVDAVHDYFEIARENKLDGIIELEPKVGASVLEPWHRDTDGAVNRLESTLQSIRRRGFVNITPTNGGYLVGVEVFKELENTPGLAASIPGTGTFQQNDPLQRDLDLVVGHSTLPGWLPLGRDEMVEQRMLLSLQRKFMR